MPTMTKSASTTAIPYMARLHEIAVGEANSARMLRTWADVTLDAELACTLRLVADREASHAEVFGRLIRELGGEVCWTPDSAAYARLAVVANPALSDLDKIVPIPEGDFFVDIKKAIADKVYDPMTATHMRWWIDEEYDSLDRLRAAHAAVRAKAQRAPAMDCADGCATAEPSSDAQAMMACMSEGFARLEKSLEKLARAVK